MPNDEGHIDHHFIVRSGARSFPLDNRRVDITSAVDGAVYTYRRALFGHDATMTRDRQLILEVKRGRFLRRGDTELNEDAGRPIARAREGPMLHVSALAEVEFKIESADLSRGRARDSRFLYSDADVRSEVCGRIDKLSWLSSVLEVKLPGKIPKSVALFSAWWMWRRWERAKSLG